MVALTGLIVFGGWLVPWDWLPGGTLRPPEASSVFTAAELADAEAYSSRVRLLSQLGYFLSLLVAVVLGFTGWGSGLVRRLQGRRRSLAGPTGWWQRMVVVLAGSFVLVLVGRLVALPFSLAIRRENLRSGLTRQELGPWLWDRLLSLLVAWVLTALLLLILVQAARRWPRWWFSFAGGAAVTLTFVASLAYPVVVEPLFNRFTAMPEGPLRTSLLQLAAQADVQVEDVLVADASRRTTTLNAYVSGIGNTRRVVVYDNLLTSLPPREVRSVVAHELGHARSHDVLLGTGLGALSALAAVAALALVLDAPAVRRRARVSGPADPAVVAVVLALTGVGGLVASPVQNLVSRAIEARADRFALTVTQDRQAFERLQVQLARRSLADPTPPELSRLWFGSHPTVLQRLGIAAAVLPGRSEGGAPPDR